jgi:hypothetical protein
MQKKRIFYVQYANPAAYPPTINGAHILAEMGWEVRVYGTHFESSKDLEFPPHELIRVECEPLSAPGLRLRVAYALFLFKAVGKALFWRPDWIYVCDNLASPAGWLLKKVFRRRVLYHEHDDPRQVKESHFMKVIIFFRRSLARGCDFTILPQRRRQEIFLEETGTLRPSLFVPNCPRAVEVAKGASPERGFNNRLGIYFHGSINPNMVPKALVVGAIRSGVPVHLRVVGYETESSAGWSRQLQEAGAGSDMVTVELVGPVSRDKLHAQMAGMHVGWVNFQMSDGGPNCVMKHLAGASNKAFDYMAAGLALMVPNDPEWADFYSTCSMACDSEDAERIAEILRMSYECPAGTRALGEAGRRLVRDAWNYDAVFSQVVDKMTEISGLTGP